MKHPMPGFNKGFYYLPHIPSCLRTPMKPGLRLNIGGHLTQDRFPNCYTCVDMHPDADVVCKLGEQKLPFDDNSAEAIYCSHMLEHIYPHRLEGVFDEFYRVLQPGKKIRIVVPDMAIFIQMYINSGQQFTEGRVQKEGYSLPPTTLMNVQEVMCGYDLDPKCEDRVIHDHVMGFDHSTLAWFLHNSGFKKLNRMTYPEHSIEFFECDNPMHEWSSLYMEASKPLGLK